MLPIMEQEFVKKKKWIKSEDLVDVIAIVQSVPGIIAVNAAVFVGNKVAGFRGALAVSIEVVILKVNVIWLIAGGGVVGLVWYNWKLKKMIDGG